MAVYLIRFYLIILLLIISLQGAMMGHPTPVYLPVNIDDETFNAIITQRPDLKYILKEQRKNQLLHHNQMPYLLKKKNGSTEYVKAKQKPILLVENDDDDITKPLSDYNDGRTTVDIDPTLVIEPDRMMYQKYKKRRSNSTNKRRFKGPSRRGWELRWWPRTHEQYAWDNSWWAANCYNCWAYNRGGIHRNHLCHTAFHSQNWVYRTQKRYFRTVCYYNWEYRLEMYWKYKTYLWYGEYEYWHTRGLTLHRMGPFTKGCMKRYSDVGEIFTVRACRGYWPQYIGGILENRQIRMDFWISRHDNSTCRVSHHASIIPFHRGISLFGRFHSCSCLGRYCNSCTANNIYMPLLIIAFLLISNQIKIYLL